MRNRFMFKKGASAIEYALLITAVVVALIGMQAYVKRAVSGRWRDAADTLGHGQQYDPVLTTLPPQPPAVLYTTPRIYYQNPAPSGSYITFFNSITLTVEVPPVSEGEATLLIYRDDQQPGRDPRINLVRDLSSELVPNAKTDITWDGKDFNEYAVPSAIYVAVLCISNKCDRIAMWKSDW